MAAGMEKRKVRKIVVGGNQNHTECGKGRECKVRRTRFKKNDVEVGKAGLSSNGREARKGLDPE